MSPYPINTANTTLKYTGYVPVDRLHLDTFINFDSELISPFGGSKHYFCLPKISWAATTVSRTQRTDLRQASTIRVPSAPARRPPPPLRASPHNNRPRSVASSPTSIPLLRPRPARIPPPPGLGNPGGFRHDTYEIGQPLALSCGSLVTYAPPEGMR